MRGYDEYIIEHPRRGCLREFEHDYDGSVKARFTTTGARNDPDKTMIMPTFTEALRALQKVPTPTRWECYIAVRSPEEHSYYKLVKI
jgi:hypothetical protein